MGGSREVDRKCRERSRGNEGVGRKSRGNVEGEPRETRVGEVREN